MTNETLAALIQEGNEELHPVLWQKIQKLLYAKAASYYCSHSETCERCGVELSDIRQECYAVYLAMVKAYDPERGLMFTSYLDYQFLNTVNALVGLRSERQRHEPLNRAASLDKPIETADGDPCTLMDMIPDTASMDFLEGVDRDSEAAFIRQIVEDLDEPFRAVIKLHFFEGRTLQEIGEDLGGVTAERVRQLKYKALRKLRQNGQLRRMYAEQLDHDRWAFASRWEYSPERFALIRQLQQRDLSYGRYQAELYAARQKWEQENAEPGACFSGKK